MKERQRNDKGQYVLTCHEHLRGHNGHEWGPQCGRPAVGRIQESGSFFQGYPVCGIHKRSVARLNEQNKRWHKRFTFVPLEAR